MGTLTCSETTRYLLHTPNVMIAAVEFNDGPAARPDSPPSHPHEQASATTASITRMTRSKK